MTRSNTTLCCMKYSNAWARIIKQDLNSQKTLHISHSRVIYGVSIVKTWEKLSILLRHVTVFRNGRMEMSKWRCIIPHLSYLIFNNESCQLGDGWMRFISYIILAMVMEYLRYNLITIFFIIDSIVIFPRKQNGLSPQTFQKINGNPLHTWINFIHSMDK